MIGVTGRPYTGEVLSGGKMDIRIPLAIGDPQPGEFQNMRRLRLFNGNGVFFAYFYTTFTSQTFIRIHG